MLPDVIELSNNKRSVLYEVERRINRSESTIGLFYRRIEVSLTEP
jgi:hypothetical protein